MMIEIGHVKGSATITCCTQCIKVDFPFHNLFLILNLFTYGSLILFQISVAFSSFATIDANR